MSEWREANLGELAARTPNALATGPFGSAISAKHFVDHGVPVIRGSNLSLDTGVRLRDKELAFLTPEKATSFGRSIARRGDLIFTCWGTIGQVGLVDDRAAFDQYVVSNKQMKLTPDQSQVDNLFLYYLMSSPAMVAQVQQQSIGAAVPGFNLGQLRQLRVRVPELASQRRIAAILGTLDDLIENNRRRIQILEEMAKAIYREWFVHFRFPGYKDRDLVKSVGLVPDGWKVCDIGDVLELRYGKALKAGDRRGGPVAVVGSSGIVGWHDEPLVSGPVVVVGRKGNVGAVTWITGSAWPIDTTYYVASELPLPFVYEQLTRTEFVNSHAAVPGLNREDAYSRPFLIPERDVIERYADLWETLNDERYDLEKAAAATTQIRQLLLPKLISGQIDLSALSSGAAMEVTA